MNSEPMTPMNEYITASFAPVNRYGPAQGSIRCTAVSQRPRWYTFAVFQNTAGTRSRPFKVLMIIATNAYRNPITVLGIALSPNSTMNRG